MPFETENEGQVVGKKWCVGGWLARPHAVYEGSVDDGEQC
jgi:hypothetical protein